MISKTEHMYAPFVISSIADEDEVGKKVETDLLIQEFLNQHLKLSTYGEGLTGIAFVYIVTPPIDVIHQDEIIYRAKKKELYIEMRLSYEKVVAASDAEVLQMMAQKYLQTFQDKSLWKKLKGFDCKGFSRDVQRLFEEQEWLKVVELV
ncbi:hypothetical protein [Haliscomenobacter hydrossis]|uniref:Uncharacterized protein n=1 Tax=Haliscomenobacter hydrossis (strain ATCC 27775 / DSM 1100 / LMG 10767 / O) TaxID=760192 RepID=F4KZK4_HALH1|nr:hypothetical protein [Haliscomenobacter hydrossis]AEE49474.1 hypothetical protein Halhy_1583 [Haliscomenobacter hydrossis DSM 1100]